jgi:hypothetical protein
MKFADRSALERTAINAWIRASLRVREDKFMKVPDDFIRDRQKLISETPGDIAKMLRLYGVYQTSKQMLSYTDYFQVSNPEEYAAMVLEERKIA